MDKSILDYDQSLNDLERQKEQLELVMQQMGEEWAESGPGVNWLKTLQSPLLQSDEQPLDDPRVTTTMTSPTMGVDEMELVGLASPLTPDTPMQSDGKLFHILQQPEPSPEYLQSLLHVNETLLAQSLAAAPINAKEHTNFVSTTTTTTTTTTALLSPSSDVVGSYVYNPIDTSPVLSTTFHTPPTTPEDEENVADTPRILSATMSTMDPLLRSSCPGLQLNKSL
ncbi:hypothetical protein BCR42DRAFT_409476 [Absidia repens]|uniref:Uncharacterized protein n=1 Tax=Absidia repens TaxID=90262 RepID=A0A1X2IR66_9FUNG|nr:hypothetical protein BCR42DRAFT_409476 [Absidia repens]